MALFLFFSLFFSLFAALPGVEEGTEFENDEECPAGAQCRRGEQNLPACPAGFIVSPPGTFRSEGPAGPSHLCSPCPVGFFSPTAGQSSCSPCPVGSFNPTAGQSSCSPCPVGSFNPRAGQSSCSPCPVGFFNPRAGQSSCSPCPKGFFNPTAGQSSCSPCPKGFFNPRAGQSSCWPCGSLAVQPKEGQRTCECLGPGQVFQPRDSLCTCPPGFRSSGRDGKCVSQTYPVCWDSASRNQEGQCLTKRGWARYCSHKVCASPRDFQGYDKALGFCICRSDSLERVCNSQCRRHQKSTLQLTCAGKKIQLFITHGNGSKTAVFLENLRKVLPRPNFSLEDVCATGQETHPAHIVEMSEKGFLGVYNPDPELIHDLVVLDESSALDRMSSPSAAAPDHPGREECGDPREFPPNSTSQPKFFGILNPITCISGNVSLVFLISREHFPLYDINNLYNTNAEFDWGDFRSLREEIGEISRNSQNFLLFLFQFQAPGTYVLQLSSNRHKRMYVRVMPAGTRCQEEGPFLPGLPRLAVQVGIGRSRELQLGRERAAIAAGTWALLLLLAGLAWALLCQGLGWTQRSRPSPAFRRQQLKYNLDSFSSKIPAVTCSSKIPAVFSMKKPHPSLQHQAGHSCSTPETAAFLRGGDPWDPEDQIDLDSFNTKIFFELLLRQSQSVTSNLGHFKEEVKVVYHRVMNEISLLKNLWLKALSSPGKGEEDEESTAKQQVPFPGSPGRSGTSQSPKIFGTPEISNDPRDSIPQKLIPLLQSALQMLQENKKINLSPENPAEPHKWLMKKKQDFLHLLSSSRRDSLGQKAHPEEEILSSFSPSELEDKVDALTEELVQILEDEEQFLSSEGNEDFLSYYLEITSLEKENLVKQINALEEEIAQGRKL